jgi:hypothetical protein
LDALGSLTIQHLTDRVTVYLEFRRTQRSSSQPLFDFNATIVSLNFELRF